MQACEEEKMALIVARRCAFVHQIPQWPGPNVANSGSAEHQDGHSKFSLSADGSGCCDGGSGFKVPGTAAPSKSPNLLPPPNFQEKEKRTTCALKNVSPHNVSPLCKAGCLFVFVILFFVSSALLPCCALSCSHLSERGRPRQLDGVASLGTFHA